MGVTVVAVVAWRWLWRGEAGLHYPRCFRIVWWICFWCFWFVFGRGVRGWVNVYQGRWGQGKCFLFRSIAMTFTTIDAAGWIRNVTWSCAFSYEVTWHQPTMQLCEPTGEDLDDSRREAIARSCLRIMQATGKRPIGYFPFSAWFPQLNPQLAAPGTKPETLSSGAMLGVGPII